MDAFPPPKIRTSVSWPDQRPETRVKGCDLRSRHAKQQQGKDEDEKRIQQKDMAGTLRSERSSFLCLLHVNRLLLVGVLEKWTKCTTIFVSLFMQRCQHFFH
ncbi:hypothetical protein T09_12389 [Trichinella sp. T9]|uniref:Uncharacterized protein n=1 Tax=Trichinella murrelli TaxID=144512 RepID=A0A0V0TRE3_9BILA|nr:hypothetical protein T05_8555 [Trichinella murrelli]KRX61548.1 hypothetical protein T09_12389 [Trichinella sp. T9]